MSRHAMPHTERWQALLSRRLGVNEAGRLLARAQSRYDLLDRQTPELPADMDRAQWRLRVLPVLALYKVLREEGWGAEAALALMETLLWSTFERERRIMGWLRRFPRWAAWPLFRALMRLQLRWFYKTGTWRWVREDDRRVLAFDVTRCAIHATLKAQRAPELTSVFCAMDDRLAELLPSFIHWRRSGTLARRDACCDFRYARD
jgi:hypothetical protein